MNNLYQRMTPEAYSLISKLREAEREMIVETLVSYHSHALVSLFEAKIVCKTLGLPQDFASFENLFLSYELSS